VDYRGLAALVLAVALGLTLVLGVAGVMVTGNPLTEFGAKALTAIGGALVGALAGYMLGKNGKKS
jgi:membrane associated rhomboid family serine protease